MYLKICFNEQSEWDPYLSNRSPHLYLFNNRKIINSFDTTDNIQFKCAVKLPSPWVSQFLIYHFICKASNISQSTDTNEPNEHHVSAVAAPCSACIFNNWMNERKTKDERRRKNIDSVYKYCRLSSGSEEIFRARKLHDNCIQSERRVCGRGQHVLCFLSISFHFERFLFAEKNKIIALLHLNQWMKNEKIEIKLFHRRHATPATIIIGYEWMKASQNGWISIFAFHITFSPRFKFVTITIRSPVKWGGHTTAVLQTIYHTAYMRHARRAYAKTERTRQT